MEERTYTIGELSRLSGVSVRRLRFYADEGLLPPLARTGSGYRLFTEADAARLDLIGALREAGTSLEQIRKLMARKSSLADVLKLRLEALEGEIALRRRVAAVLRATLRSADPSETELRRLWTVMKFSHAQFRAMIERFIDRVVEDAHIDKSWKRQLIEVSTPELPDDPTPEQIDAWNELAAMIGDEGFIAKMRADAAHMWNADYDAAAYRAAAEEITLRIKAALDEGVQAASPAGAAIARDWLERSAAAMQRKPDETFLEWHLAQYRKHHSGSARYQELLAILRGEGGGNAIGAEWRWIDEALQHLRPSGEGAGWARARGRAR